MLNGVFIFLDDDFAHPLYASPEPDEVEPELYGAICERVGEALEDEGPVRGAKAHGELLIAWSTDLKSGLTFATFAEDVTKRRLDRYLKSVAERYFDEVDDVRSPDPNGVEDVVIDVIPPWEETEDDED